ncbi:MAG: arginine--tRNA ligase [Saprospiraceae bacterium]|nr:arginine--tRNA ligase [Saprospiraceae bacterium]
MSRISEHIATASHEAIAQLLDLPINEVSRPVISETKKDFEGDYTLVVFPYVRLFKSKPEDAAEKIGEKLSSSVSWLSSFNVVKGFLNLKLNDRDWHTWLRDQSDSETYLTADGEGKTVTVEFSSPNTNKPLHLGHIRNILLGWSASRLLEATGHEVVKTQIVNDRGIAICKSMLAWVKFGEGETPSTSDSKGDHFVGEYYVKFEKEIQKEYKEWQASDRGKAVYKSLANENEESNAFFTRYKNIYFNEHSSLGQAARDMLQRWERGDQTTREIWERMNGWVYEGFDATYDRLGVEFDKIYYESDTYVKGKEIVEEGLQKGVFYTEEDGSVWADLTDANMDKKIVLRSDGTALYITQDLGTAEMRFEDYKMDKAVYVVADEQDYHFQVLFELMKRLGRPFADDLHHLSYGMVDLPTGKMKSREGTVVDADDLMEEVVSEAKKGATERGELADLDSKVQEEIFEAIGLGALKYFILKVNPRKRMTYDPQESLDMQGQTGPYIQNAYVRIQSVLRKSQDTQSDHGIYESPSDFEKGLIKSIDAYPDVLREASGNLDPSAMANYLYSMAKQYHRFYHEHRILTAETEEAKAFRLLLSKTVGETLKNGMNLLGISMPVKM